MTDESPSSPIIGGGINTGHINQPVVVTQILGIDPASDPVREETLRARYLSFEPVFDAESKLCAYELVLKGRLARLDGPGKLAQMDEDMLLTGLYSLVEDGLSGEFPLLIRISQNVLLSDIPLQLNQPELIWITPITDRETLTQALALRDAGLRMCPVLDPADPLLVGSLPAWPYLQLPTDMPPLAALPGVRFVIEHVTEAHSLTQWPRNSWFKGSLFTGEMQAQARNHDTARRLDLLAIALRQPLDTLIQFFRLNPDMAPRLIMLASSLVGGLSRTPDSATHALVLLGRQRAQRVATLLALAGCRPTLQTRLFAKTAFIRALFMGKIVRLGAPANEASSAFEVGLYSTASHALELPFKVIVRKLGLSAHMAETLTGHPSPENTLLRLVHACEARQTEAMIGYAHELGVNLDDISSAFLDALLAGEALDAALA